jgi:hypothetical protein
MEISLPSVYVETSVVSYLSARESSSLIGAAHQLVTRRWWDRRNLYRCFVSDVVIRECRAGDPTAALRRLDAIRECSSLAINDQAIEIAEALLDLGIVPKKAAEDALHVAIATAHGMDFLLTWNCRHIANPVIQAGIAAHLENVGLLLPFICTPEELLGEENE